MSDFAPLFLAIHILTAIIAFGPNFALPLIAGMAAREPQHGLFAVRLIDRIERRLVLPLALTMPISGGLLVWSESIDLVNTHWLLLAIGLYITAIVFALGVQVRTIDRMIKVAGQMGAGGPAAAGAGAEPAQPGAGVGEPVVATPKPAAAASRLAGLGAEMAALGIRARNGGFFLMFLIVAIVSLMAGKPSI